MNRYLICYIIGIQGQSGYIAGHAFFSATSLTESAIRDAMDQIAASNKTAEPNFTFNTPCITSVCKLDQ